MEIIREVEFFGGPFDGLKQEIRQGAEPAAVAITFSTGSGKEKRVVYARRDQGRYVHVQREEEIERSR